MNNKEKKAQPNSADIKAVITRATTVPVVPTEVKAANQPYEANAPTNFAVTPEGEKYGIVPINGTLGHVQAEQGQPYRNPEINKNIATLYQQEFAPNEKVDYNDPAKVQNFVSTQWAKNKDKMPELYARKNLISTQPAVVSDTQPQSKAEQLVKEAADTGKSWLQLYHEQMPKPEYNSKRANALQTNANLSVLGDIIKLASEGVTTDQGGTPIARQSMAPHLNAQLAQLNDLYKREVQAYNQNGFQYLMADERDKRARAAAVRAEQLRLSAENQKQKNWERQFEANGSSKEEATQLARERMAQSDRQHKESLSATRQNHLETLAAAKDKKSSEKTKTYIDENNIAHIVPTATYNAWSNKVAELASKEGKYPDGTDIDSDVMTAIKAYPENAAGLIGGKFINVKDGVISLKPQKPASYALKPGEYRENGQVMKKVPVSETKKVVSQKPYNPVTNAFVLNNNPVGLDSEQSDKSISKKPKSIYEGIKSR